MNQISLMKDRAHLQPGLRKLMLCAVVAVLSACSSLSEHNSGKSYSRATYSSSAKVKADPPVTASADAESTSSVQENQVPEQTDASMTTTIQPAQAPDKASASSQKAPDTAKSEQPVATQKITPKAKVEKIEKVSPSKKIVQSSEVVAKDDASLSAGKHTAATVSETNKALEAQKNIPDNQTEALGTADPEPTPPANNIDYGVTLESLPLSIGANWTLNREPASAGSCALFYREQMMNDGQGETPVRLIISASSLRFKTRSNIDVSYNQTGIRLDKQTQIPIEHVLNETDIVYEKRFATIVNAMKTAQQLTLSLGFWPTWPVTQAYHLDFDVSDFSFAFNKLDACVKLDEGLH